MTDELTAHNWLLARAEQTPDAPAIESEGESWTFAQLADRARRAAEFVLATAPESVPAGESPEREPPMADVSASEALSKAVSSRELQSGDAPLALLLPGDARFAAWFHGVALAGRTVLPLNLRLSANEIAGQLAHARVRWLLGEAGDPRLEELSHCVPGLQIRHVDALSSNESRGAARRDLPGSTFERETSLAVLFTSGTAGRAKGACLTYGNFLASAAAAAERLGPAVVGRWLCCMPMFHVGGLSIMVRSALYGGAVRLQPRFDPAAVSDALDRDDIAGISLVPTMLSRLLDHRGERPAPASLRVVLLGGAAAPPALIERALAAGYPICPTYGLTEATSQVATAAPPTLRGLGRSAESSAMRALAGVELRIVSDGREPGVVEVDDAGQPGVPDEPGVAVESGIADESKAAVEAGDASTVGEILVCGPIVMKGYLNDTGATARVLRDGWLHTGDIGYLDAQGGLHVLDRRDDLVVSGGENVYPAEIEAVLLEHAAVADAGVTGVPDDDLGARVVAWIVRRPGVELDAATLVNHCSSRLAGYKRPREFRFIDTLPRNAAGKLQRRRLTAIQVRS